MATGEGLGSPVSPDPGPGDFPGMGAATSTGGPAIRPDPGNEEQQGDAEGGGGPILKGPGMEPPGSPREMARGKTCRVLFTGRGYATWEEGIQKTVEELNPGQALAEIGEIVNNHGHQGLALYIDEIGW